MQSLSHNWPSKINEELFNSGNAVAVCACFGRFDERDNWPILLGLIEPAYGNNTAGPMYGFVFFRQAASVIRI